ncbi:hypothetical protein EYF80_058676 [Liparis tanakae]|uniref:Uncharacterized protein n=1 Tax=Liparis tanakae TaxID=230148 RepID=A0A4Z2EQV2_9TELE|nr:hypothetical protein EYF80_058676 [Liparis tanakae]
MQWCYEEDLACDPLTDGGSNASSRVGADRLVRLWIVSQELEGHRELRGRKTKGCDCVSASRGNAAAGSTPDLVEVARPSDGSDLVGVVEEADAGLRQAVALSDLDAAKASGELPPDVRPEAASRRQPNAVGLLLGNLEAGYRQSSPMYCTTVTSCFTQSFQN